MKKGTSKTKSADDLRKRAEKKIPRSTDSTGKMAPLEIQKLIHELNVHQIELEMQNEALRQSQAETAESQYKYSDLYDFAPVGYFTLDKKGHIIEANVTGASLLGAEKRSLAKQPFQRFIIPVHFSIFQSHLQNVHETRNKQICKLKLKGKDGSLFDALIDTIVVIDGEGKFAHYRSTVTDITDITRAEALRESEIKYRGLYESTRDGMIMTDTEGHILECNRAYSDMLGYAAEEIKGLTYQQLTPAKWHDMEKGIIKNKVLKMGYSDIYEKECIRKDGTVFPVFMRMWAIKDETGNVTGMWGLATDVTERKRAEETVRLSMQRLELALDAAKSGTWEWDLRTNENIWSDELWKLYGLEPHSCQPTYEVWRRTIHPHDRAKTDQVVQEAARNGTELNAEWRVLYQDGEERWLMSRGRPLLDANGQVERFIGVVIDITERKRAEVALRESEERYQILFEGSIHGILVVDIETGRFIYANPSICRMFGYSATEFRQLGIEDIHPGDSLDHVKTEFELQRRGEKVLTGGIPCLRKDGTVFYADITAAGTIINGRECFAGFFADITERRQAEQSLAERTAQLEAANKELESFSYSVAHDLRAPLRAIDGYARMILKKQGDNFDKDTLDKFNVIRSNTHMMGQLIDDLLAFSRLGRKHVSPTTLDMDSLVRDVWKEMQNINPNRNMVLTVNGILPGYGDRALIKQLYINLLSNAVKFTKNRHTAHIEAGGYSDGNEVVYYVRDNGVGFDMEYHDKLFGVFQRLHSADAFEGTGVGLAIVQRIVHRHGGRVWAEGKTDQGACFYFTLSGNE